ncbi:hypothetical protein KSP40_PGU017207 [Platanthera guangdongensis]|uniref:Uncharacterized protein n=1 Tax=Platanthera guangdongensis TaxID=2320717 RepID=A0ABR2MLW4_9ASPA
MAFTQLLRPPVSPSFQSPGASRHLAFRPPPLFALSHARSAGFSSFKKPHRREILHEMSEVTGGEDTTEPEPRQPKLGVLKRERERASKILCTGGNLHTHFGISRVALAIASPNHMAFMPLPRGRRSLRRSLLLIQLLLIAEEDDLPAPIKAEQQESGVTLAADVFANIKHVLLPITDRNPFLSEGTIQAAVTTASLAKKYGAEITVVGGFKEFRLLERLGEEKKPTSVIGEVADDLNLDLVVLSMEAIHSKHVDGFICFGGGGSIRRVETECSKRRGDVAAPNGAFWGVSQGGRVETEQTPPEVHLFTRHPAAFAQNGAPKRPNK